MRLLAYILLLFIMYFLSSGAAFVATYKFPGRAPIRFFGRFYFPLDWLARHNVPFQNIYNGFQGWCYRRFVGADNKRRPGD
jgi:hypothetical protein